MKKTKKKDNINKLMNEKKEIKINNKSYDEDYLNTNIIDYSNQFNIYLEDKNVLNQKMNINNNCFYYSNYNNKEENNNFDKNNESLIIENRDNNNTCNEPITPETLAFTTCVYTPNSIEESSYEYTPQIRLEEYNNKTKEIESDVVKEKEITEGEERGQNLRSDEILNDENEFEKNSDHGKKGIFDIIAHSFNTKEIDQLIHLIHTKISFQVPTIMIDTGSLTSEHVDVIEQTTKTIICLEAQEKIKNIIGNNISKNPLYETIKNESSHKITIQGSLKGVCAAYSMCFASIITTL